MSNPNWLPRLATEYDIPAIQSLLEDSARRLQADVYSPVQIEAAIGPIFAVDRQLIQDQTYYLVEHEDELVGCGGWSRRKTLFGASRGPDSADNLLEPTQDPAKVRAFFVHPDWARKGIGSAIMRVCEEQIRKAGFNSVEMVATLSGEPLYASFGHDAIERFQIPMANGLELPAVRMRKSLEIDRN